MAEDKNLINNAKEMGIELDFDDGEFNHKEPDVKQETNTVSVEKVDSDSNSDEHLNAIIKIVDDTDALTQIKTISGFQGESLNRQIKQIVNQRLSSGYILTNKDILSKQVVLTNNLNDIVLHFQHKMENVSRKKEVTETIRFSISDGSRNIAPHKQTLVFEQKGLKDLVTNQYKWDRKPITKEFKEFVPQRIDGYSIDTGTDSDVIPSISITVDSNNWQDDINIVKMVNYLVDSQVIILQFVDKDTQEVRTKTLNGFTNEKSAYDVQMRIDKFLRGGYRLVKDETKGTTLKFNDKTGQNQVYKIEFEHKIKTLTLSDSINPLTNESLAGKLKHVITRTIAYNTPRTVNAIKDTVQKANFTRTAKLDLVTGDINYSRWSKDVKLPSVDVPAIAGYKSSLLKIDSLIVKETDSNVVETIDYQAEKKTIEVIYFDKVSKSIIKKISLDGFSDANSEYSTTSQIQTLEIDGYKLLNDPTKGRNLIFDRNKTGQKYVIEFEHKFEKVSVKNPLNPVTNENIIGKLSKIVTLKINFNAPDYIEGIEPLTKEIVFNRIAKVDMITGKAYANDWSEIKTLKPIMAPKIEGYIATPEIISDLSFTGNSHDKTINVNYSATEQTIRYILFDTNIKKAVAQKTKTGFTNKLINFDINKLIESYESRGYQVVNKPEMSKTYLPHDEDYRIELAHKTQDVTLENSINPVTQNDEKQHLKKKFLYVIKYVYKNGNQAMEANQQTLSYHRTGIVDLVTGNVKYNSWQKDNTLSDIVSPEISNYVPDKKEIAVPNDLESNQEIVVTYYVQKQYVKINFLDSNKQTVKSETIVLDYDNNTGFNIQHLLNQITGDGYAIDTKHIEKQLYYDKTLADKRTINIDVHETFTISTEKKNITRNITMVIPNKDISWTNQTAVLTRKVTRSNVTGKETKGSWSANIWPSIIPSSVPGYEPSVEVVNQQVVTSESENINLQITYHQVEVGELRKKEEKELKRLNIFQRWAIKLGFKHLDDDFKEKMIAHESYQKIESKEDKIENVKKETGKKPKKIKITRKSED